jgi:hypothetical protein
MIMQIFLNNLKGKTIALDVDSLDTVEKLKAKIEYKEGIPAVGMCLSFQSKPLENDKTLSDYNIQKGKILV